MAFAGHVAYDSARSRERAPDSKRVSYAWRDRGPKPSAKAGAFHSAGLGLSFCKLAVEAHGGAIGMHDAEPRGSVFWFELPR